MASDPTVQDIETPLAKRLKTRIRRSGPISVHDYMQACLLDDAYGYYKSHKAVGRDGDFTTAPEISQVFGELIGLWAGVVWQQMGSPRAIDVVELGPGRGTLLCDALRAAQVLPGFVDAISVNLVEVNSALVPQQQKALDDIGVGRQTVSSLAEYAAHRTTDARAVILLANEFLDALPVRQYVRAGDVFKKRLVDLDPAGTFVFALSDERTAIDDRTLTSAVNGDVIEICPGYASAVLAPLKQLSIDRQLAALFIDYGHEVSGAGDSLQSVLAHQHVSPFHAPGESDLTCQVDFGYFKRIALDDESAVAPLAADGPLSQAEFLGHLGIVQRTSKLMAANPAKAPSIEAGVQRLMSPGGMGGRFKAVGLRRRDMAPLPGFPAATPARRDI